MINPIVVIILSAYILSFLVLRIVVKPKKPIFTGALLVMLILFVIVTSMIDTSIYGSELMSDFESVENQEIWGRYTFLGFNEGRYW